MANLDGSGLSEVWVRAAQLVKKYTGAVDSTKGDLQTQVNKKLSGTDDTKDNTVTFTSADELNPTVWKEVNVLSSNEKHLSILNKISNMFSNIRYLYKNVGGIKGLSSSSAITTQGEYALDAREKNASVDGTLANQISNLNSNLDRTNSILRSTSIGKSYSQDWSVLSITTGIDFKCFSNWYNSADFPENAGVGIIIPAIDVNWKAILYLSLTSNTFYYGKLNFGSNGYTIDWKKVAVES